MESRIEDFVGKNYLVVYVDDTGRSRSKKLHFVGKDNVNYYFINPKSGKCEILPIKVVTRMEEVSLGDSEQGQRDSKNAFEVGGRKNVT